jgi:hypothetical protein
VQFFDRSVAQALLEWSAWRDEDEDYDDRDHDHEGDDRSRTVPEDDLAKRELLAKRVAEFRTLPRLED